MLGILVLSIQDSSILLVSLVFSCLSSKLINIIYILFGTYRVLGGQVNTHRADRGNRGQGIVEFAIVFPLLLLLLFGISEFGRIMFAYSAAVTASREAARYGAAILDTGGGIPQYEDCAGIRAAAKRIGQYAGINDADITIQYSNVSGIYSTSCPPSQEVNAADTISVSINTSITPVTPIGNFSAIPISSSSSRTILKNVKLGFSGTGAGSVSGSLSDVNFKTTSQTAEETQGTISVVLELNQAATDVVTIPFSVTGTALQGPTEDYLMTSSPVIINPGYKTATIYISLNNDGISEGDELLVIGIDDPINATKGPQNIHTITIVDSPEISFSTTTSVHAESSPVTALMVELSKGSTQDVSVSFNFTGSAVWGTGGDYTTNPATVTVPSGSLSAMLMLQVNDDSFDENDETGVVSMSSPVNGLIGANSTHTLTIVDDDLPPQISFFVPNQIVSEEIGVFTTSLTLSEVSGKTITVPYTISGTTIPADYVIHNPSPLVIPAGNSTVDINMDILEGDGLEVDETLVLTLGTPQNASLGSPAVQTIVITETSYEPTVSFASSSQSLVEDDRLLTLTVQLSNAWSVPVVVPFVLSGSAQLGSGADYSISASPLIIPVGWTQGGIQVAVHEDNVDEDAEDIIVTMGAIENGNPGGITSHQIQILDNDSAPEAFITTTNKTVLENSGPVAVTVGLSSPSEYPITVPLNLSGSAGQGSDYSISTTSLVIPAGSTSENFQIILIDDTQYDPGEKVVVTLGSPTNAELGSPTSFTLLIEDNELPPCGVGSHLLTIGTDTFNLSMVNEGETVVYTGGSVSWPAASPNLPRLTEVSFGGSVVFAGSEKPTSYLFSAWESFYTLSTESVRFEFDEPLGIGVHIIVSNFQNTVSGTTCSLTESFTIH
jgi:Flp pilus assembly protein TadG